jgi:inosose dehydratase
MTGIHIGCVPITWGQFRRAAEGEWPEERVLAEVAQAGYEGVSAGPRGSRTPADTVALLAQYGLKPAPGYLGGRFWVEDAREELLESAKRQAAFARAVGLTELYVAAGGGEPAGAAGPTRRQLSGHVGPEDGLSAAENRRFADLLNAVGELTLREGVRICFHNHVGTVIETREEVDRLLELTDPALVFLGLDTGHLAWGGADVVQFCRDYAERIKTMHLKDIDEAVRRKGAAEGWDYGTFTANGIFVELGDGCVDFTAVLQILRDAGFSGWLLAEQDVTQKPSALESVTISRNYLRGLGL